MYSFHIIDFYEKQNILWNVIVISFPKFVQLEGIF